MSAIASLFVRLVFLFMPSTQEKGKIMGCDIHVYTEVKIDGTWHLYSQPRVKRNYDLFAHMANVRNGVGIVPISFPRGMPEDASVVTKAECESFCADGHSHSWLNAEEIKELNDRQLDLDDFGYLRGDLWHWYTKTPSEDNLDQYSRIEDVRWVFWFDN